VGALAPLHLKQQHNSLLSLGLLRGPTQLGGLGEHAPISPELARVAVLEYLQRVDAGADHPGLRWEARIRDDSVVVTVEAPLDLPFTVGDVGEATVGATGAAEVRVDAG
jgi:hypothetical protein